MLLQIKLLHTSYLELGLEGGDDCGRDEAADAATVDAQHGDEPPLRRRRGQGRRVRGGGGGGGGAGAVAAHDGELISAG